MKADFWSGQHFLSFDGEYNVQNKIELHFTTEYKGIHSQKLTETFTFKITWKIKNCIQFSLILVGFFFFLNSIIFSYCNSECFHLK